MDYFVAIGFMLCVLFVISQLQTNSKYPPFFFSDRPVAYSLAILAFPLMVVSILDLGRGFALVTAFGVSWLIRRPMKGMRWPLIGFSTVTLVPAGAIAVGIVLGHVEIFENLISVIVLVSISLVSLLVDQLTEYRIRHGIDE